MAKTTIAVDVLKKIECNINCNKPQTCLVEFDVACKDCGLDTTAKMGLDVGALVMRYQTQDVNFFVISTLYNALAQWANGTIEMLRSKGIPAPEFAYTEFNFSEVMSGPPHQVSQPILGAFYEMPLDWRDVVLGL